MDLGHECNNIGRYLGIVVSVFRVLEYGNDLRGTRLLRPIPRQFRR